MVLDIYYTVVYSKIPAVIAVIYSRETLGNQSIFLIILYCTVVQSKRSTYSTGQEGKAALELAGTIV